MKFMTQEDGARALFACPFDGNPESAGCLVVFHGELEDRVINRPIEPAAYTVVRLCPSMQHPWGQEGRRRQRGRAGGVTKGWRRKEGRRVTKEWRR